MLNCAVLSQWKMHMAIMHVLCVSLKSKFLFIVDQVQESDTLKHVSLMYPCLWTICDPAQENQAQCSSYFSFFLLTCRMNDARR